MAMPLLAQFGGGAGTSGSPYQVANIYHLYNVRDYLSAYFIQTADIDLAVTNDKKIIDFDKDSLYVVGNVRANSGYAYYCIQNMTTNDDSQDPGNDSYWKKMWEVTKGWEPIGTQQGNPINTAFAFTGVYDGNGKLIYNLFINRGASACNNDTYATDGQDNIGLFGFVTNTNTNHTEIKNLGLIDANVTGRRATGSLVGKVLNPHRNPTYAFTVLITKCYAIKSESGTATVKGFGATGGLVGANNSDRKQQVPYIRFSYAKVTVSATHPNNYALNPNDSFGSPVVYNPYNIKYGGLVGCNENGVTQDCYARGNVSGGDRVGGLAGCTIEGAIFRSYSTGTVTRGITPGTWQGGIGGLVGRVDGSLPPGLGGTQGTGSVQDCYWDTQTSGTSSSAGGTGKTTAEMKTQNTFVNWDFTNVWSINSGVNDGYPHLQGTPTSVFYYRTDPDADWTNGKSWSDISSWEYSADGSSWSNAIVVPDISNSISISIAHKVLLGYSLIIDQCTITTAGELVINSGNTLSILNGEGTDLAINGKLTITGTFVIGNTAVVTAGSSSIITFNGSSAQNTGTGFPSPVNNLIIDNNSGVTFTDPVTVDGLLTVLSGSVSGSTDTDGYHSPDLNRFEIDETGFYISSYSISMITNQSNNQFIKRMWTINGNINNATESNRVKTLTFYWTSADDYDFAWGTTVPLLWAGSNSITPTSYSTSNSDRWLIADYTFPQSAKASIDFKIGLGEEQTLPVELSSFTSIPNVNGYIYLNWITQSETNLSGFYLYKGLSDNLVEASRINAMVTATNTSQQQNYVFVDEEVTPGTTYWYWLESTEINGISEFFGPVSVYLPNSNNTMPVIPLSTSIKGVYPNPFNPSAVIQIDIAKQSNVKLNIYNLKGQLIKTLDTSAKSPGTYFYKWNGIDDNGKHCTSGTYILSLITDKKVDNKKIVLIK
jgi:hypothetical protein